MAPNAAKGDTNKKEAKEKRKENGVSKSTSRKATIERKNQLNQKKTAQSQDRDSQRKQLKDIQKKINTTKALMDEEEDEEKQGQVEVLLKELLSSYDQIKRNLAAIESDIMDIDTDLKKIDQGGPIDVDGTEDENSRDGPDNENESNGSLERHQQTELADQPETDVISYGSSLSGTADPKHRDINDTNNSHDDLASQQPPPDSQPLPDAEVNSSELFVGQTEPPTEIQGASQQKYERPKDYKDYIFVDLTLDNDDGPSEQLFENGTVTLKKNARSGFDYLNSYGPLNSAMTIWSSSAASNEVQGCTYLKGDPHNKAMLEDETGKVLYKGMIRNIKKVAWQPRREGSTMLDLLESVEELNPEVKKTNPKYVFPFTTVLVDWKQGVNLPPLWVSRSNYKRLSSSAKKESLRTDRRIYAVALVQVKNYRNWAGKRLDNKWTGERRLGLEQSPTPFPETLETEQVLLRGQDHQGQNKKSESYQDQRTQGQSMEHENSQSQSTRSQTSEREHSQAHNRGNKSTQNQGNATSSTNPPQFSNENPVAYEKKSESSLQQTFNRKKFLSDILGMIDDFNILGLEKQMEMRTLALAQYDLYKRKMEEGGAMEETA
ncbi:hypothetical protein PENANT_c133G01552 [Penicillium antarcticum]|uniref:Uncharacterized protein n=1 Tax=Penicillium antarcticum TaxID=416450 RepID=A0A1V6PGU0_9EURO|nr:uncharacterized protein N7508_007314 [Penicillium antarcticum]KAJ5300071.1 hypothetical protein N7508_007314 [Penicillium antarcticum]OQD76245.1 hypothetical protein PENANT_c133G01552 [Penicillium antarcticum]